jgi:hypothetical protein
MYLFQYGSNMKFDRFVERVQKNADEFGAAGKVSTISKPVMARLGGWRFELRGHNSRKQLVCDIVEAPDGSEVWGALYEVDQELVFRSDGGRSVLDFLEGHKRPNDPDTYHPTRVQVVRDGAPCQACTYVCTAHARPCPEGCAHLAKPKYTAAVLDGAAELDLPGSYRAFLAEACARATGTRQPGTA